MGVMNQILNEMLHQMESEISNQLSQLSGFGKSLFEDDINPVSAVCIKRTHDPMSNRHCTAQAKPLLGISSELSGTSSELSFEPSSREMLTPILMAMLVPKPKPTDKVAANIQSRLRHQH